jgi:hypothetical protein
VRGVGHELIELVRGNLTLTQRARSGRLDSPDVLSSSSYVDLVLRAVVIVLAAR